MLWITYVADTKRAVTERVAKVTINQHDWSVTTENGGEISRAIIMGVEDDASLAEALRSMIDPATILDVLDDTAETPDMKRRVQQARDLIDRLRSSD